MTNELLQERMRGIRHRFLSFRNGIVSDVYRQAGSPYEIIMGLQIPQLGEIARDELAKGDTFELAHALWADRKMREPRLLACWLFNPDMNADEAVELAADCMTQEEADVLCWRLLRRLPCLDTVKAELSRRAEDSAEEGCRRCLTSLSR